MVLERNIPGQTIDRSAMDTAARWALQPPRNPWKKVCNRKRLHSTLGYLPPARFEAQLTERNIEATAAQLVA